MRPSINYNKIHSMKEIQNVGCGFADFDISLLKDTHHLRRRGSEFNAMDLLQLYNLYKRNRCHRILSIATFDVITNSFRQSSVVGKIPNQYLCVQQILHYLPVLKGSATKYSHLGRYCICLRFCDFLFFFITASIFTNIFVAKLQLLFHLAKLFLIFRDKN